MDFQINLHFYLERFSQSEARYPHVNMWICRDLINQPTEKLSNVQLTFWDF